MGPFTGIIGALADSCMYILHYKTFWKSKVEMLVIAIVKKENTMDIVS